MRRSRLPAQESAPDITFPLRQPSFMFWHCLPIHRAPFLYPRILLSASPSFLRLISVAARRLSPVIAFQHATIRTRTHLPVADQVFLLVAAHSLSAQRGRLAPSQLLSGTGGPLPDVRARSPFLHSIGCLRVRAPCTWSSRPPAPPRPVEYTFSAGARKERWSLIRVLARLKMARCAFHRPSSCC
jgi:hypothetical protein